MIALLLTQIAARWGQALVLFLLSIAATAAAVGTPAYGTAVEQAVIANEVAAADPAEFVAGVPVFERTWSGDPGADGAAERAAARAELAGFVPVTTVQIHVQEGTPDVVRFTTHRMVSRDDFCRWVVFEQGRCPVGTREAALPGALAQAAQLAPGDEVVFTPMAVSPDGWIPDGEPFSVSVVGIFEARDAADPYWVPMDPLGLRGQSPAIFVPLSVMWSVSHKQQLLSVDAVAPAELITPQQIPRLREQLARVDQRITAEGLATGLGPGLPRLLDRISGQAEQARALLPIAAVPLVALCWFVIYLAVGNGVAGRRHEVAAVTLRGARAPTRATVVAGEALLPIVAGVPVGVAVAAPLVALVGPGTGIPPIGAGGLLAGALAMAGSIVAGLLAVRRELSAPVTDLLRRATSRRRRAATVAVEVIIVMVAVALVADLRLLGGELVGVAVVAPAAVILAVAVLVGRLIRPLVDLAGRWTLRRGWLGPALAALYLARRPGVAPLLVTVGVALGMLGFAVASLGVADAGRVAQAERALGAARVLEVGPVSRGELLWAVREADPTGQYAMAVAAVPGSSGDPEALAVDATRLQAVAAWRQGGGGPEAAEVADWLRPPARDPVMIHDGGLIAELSPGLPTSDGLAELIFTLAPVTGSQPVELTFGPITYGQREYRVSVSGCPEGCRLAGAALVAPSLEGYLDRLSVVVHSLEQGGAQVGPPGWLTERDRWRPPERRQGLDHLQVAPVAEGLSLWQSTPLPTLRYEALAMDVPYPLPIVVAGDLPPESLLPGVDRQPIQVVSRAELSGLPGVGAPGVLLDLEYVERLAVAPGAAESPRVWLAADAPASVVDELREQGLVIIGERSVADLQAALKGTGPALALRFHVLGAGAAILVGFAALALVGAVDRRTWSPALRRLRGQGVARRTADRRRPVVVRRDRRGRSGRGRSGGRWRGWRRVGGCRWGSIQRSCRLRHSGLSWSVPGLAVTGVLVLAAAGIARWQRGVVEAGRR